MKSNAPGPLLGYALELPRALYHLLKSGPGDTISVEVLGDVATSKSDMMVISEEVKSSIVGNPLTDRSTDLWKTFSNWIESIKSGFLDVKKTKFILYCNQSGRNGIVNKFSSAKNPQDVKCAIDHVKKNLCNTKPDHDIWKYYNFVVNQNETLLLEVVERFELELGDGSGYEEVRSEIKRKVVPESQIDFLMENLSGWLQKEVTTKIAAGEKATIHWEEYYHHFLVLFERVHTRDLIDYSLQRPPRDEEVQDHVKIRPRYLRQLDKISISDDDILEAVSEYLRADVNRTKWIEYEIIDEDIAADFESKLRQFWKNQRNKIKITQKNLSEEERGHLLYVECKSRMQTINNITPPCSTIAGTYHALADKPVLGWHPDWENLFLKQKED